MKTELEFINLTWRGLKSKTAFLAKTQLYSELQKLLLQIFFFLKDNDETKSSSSEDTKNEL